MVLIVSLLACLSVEGEDIEFVTDDSYRGIPELQQVSAACSGDTLLVRGRSKGWMEEVYVEVWDGLGASVGEHATSVAYTRDETCDIFEWEVTGDGFGCDELDDGTLTFFLREQYEQGCAGVKAWGATDESLVYTGQISPSPEVRPVDCALEDIESDWYEDVEVVDEITRCSEPVE